ncbi:hypothetical protein FisN_10Hh044 [Fistulifera solaris]|uniref:STI1 domain-containing protein n=1 Tax=Fistulifera solaris TaxID=1519565 RepID=A0A1Z5K5J8_FISSO|nr:hypothetical protein FisN_10Hh044 [Fistulifera solaris]|eukprot:GAX21465.1 hypothetical protein FisN_10Hh044 [Fistulifera solaris]
MSGKKRGAKVAPGDELNEDAQDIIKQNLEVMYDIVMKIREDEEFAKSIYADCPRLQHMLEKRPDLRPIFEDQRLVAINFEQVYREAGGVLPEDEEEEELKKKKTNYIAMIVNSPCFKILKIFLLFKKILACIFGGGMAIMLSLWKCLCCCCDDPTDMVEDPEDEIDDDDANTANKEALYRAADHMEDPEVQQQMNHLLENDPDGLADAIEDDPELRELRDTNPLCAELMTDPETMRILTEPDNLRALGDAPALIEADFNDPDWTPPVEDVEAGTSCGGADLAAAESNTFGGHDSFQGAEYATDDGVEVPIEDDVGDIEEEGSLNLEKEEEPADEEAGEEEEEEMEFELGEAEKQDNNCNANAQNKQNKQRQRDQPVQGGFFAQVGAGITDMMAAQLVGVGISELAGQDDPFAGLEQAEGAADCGEGMAENANQAADMAAVSETLLGEDMAANMEAGIDELESANDATGGQGAAAAAGAGAAAGGVAAAGVAVSRGAEDGEGGEEGGKKKRFGVVGNWASAISSAGKEYFASALLGDDLGALVVEKIEEKDSNDNDKSFKLDEETAAMDSLEEGHTSSRRSLFSSKRSLQ